MKYGRTGQCRVCKKTFGVGPALKTRATWDARKQRHEKTSVVVDRHMGANGGVCPGAYKRPR